jgi:hypothetical protein
MVQRKLAIDPTLAIHEELTLNRNGTVPPGRPTISITCRWGISAGEGGQVRHLGAG